MSKTKTEPKKNPEKENEARIKKLEKQVGTLSAQVAVHQRSYQMWIKITERLSVEKDINIVHAICNKLLCMDLAVRTGQRVPDIFQRIQEEARKSPGAIN